MMRRITNLDNKVEMLDNQIEETSEINFKIFKENDMARRLNKLLRPKNYRDCCLRGGYTK